MGGSLFDENNNNFNDNRVSALHFLNNSVIFVFIKKHLIVSGAEAEPWNAGSALTR